LSANAINPSKGEVVIARIRPRDASPILVKIFTASGKLVRTLRNQEAMGDGQWRVVWDGRTEDEHPVARGVYIVRILGGGLSETLKVVVR
jgi:flagellar hook assembly protein FlgD